MVSATQVPDALPVPGPSSVSLSMQAMYCNLVQRVIPCTSRPRISIELRTELPVWRLHCDFQLNSLINNFWTVFGHTER